MNVLFTLQEMQHSLLERKSSSSLFMWFDLVFCLYGFENFDAILLTTAFVYEKENLR